MAVALGLFSAHAISSALAQAQAERARWGNSRSVLVAQRRLGPGDVLQPGDAEVSTWPVAMVPDGAMGDSNDAVGRTVVDDIEPGEAVVSARLAPDGLHGTAALVPIGWRALAVPSGPAVVDLNVGDRIDLVAAVAGTSPENDDARPFVLCANALVVAVDDQSITVAVPADDAPRVALGIVSSSVIPALRSG
jgi:Flp pilus assembly protein CpaB